MMAITLSDSLKDYLDPSCRLSGNEVFNYNTSNSI